MFLKSGNQSINHGFAYSSQEQKLQMLNYKNLKLVLSYRCSMCFERLTESSGIIFCIKNGLKKENNSFFFLS